MKSSVALLLLLLSPLTQAHYVWLEKDHNEARLYFGEWHKDLRENREQLQRFSAAKIFSSQVSGSAALRVEEEFISAKISGSSDARMLLDSLPVKKSRKGRIRKSYYYAKVGRTETQSRLALELVPTEANANTFTLLFNQHPLEGAEIVVYGPPKWAKHLRTSKEGQINFDTPWAGQHIVKVSHEIPPISGKATMDDPAIKHSYTGTFVVEDGIPWKH